jgi:hypothetical protein
MESWTFPPHCDEAYRPEPESRNWFAKRETMPGGGRERALSREPSRNVKPWGRV